MRRALSLLMLLSGATGCMPPSVKSVDELLFGLETGDAERVVRNVAQADRELVRKAMLAQTSSPTSDLALLLPPPPKEHKITEIETKSDDGTRHVVLTHVTFKNPLPAMSRKVGQSLEGLPETRGQRRRYLSVKEGERWGVKLDLAVTLARARLVAAFVALLDKGKLDEAEVLLGQIPPPPDDPNAQKGADRLADTLKAELSKRRHPPGSPGAQKSKTSSAAAAP